MLNDNAKIKIAIKTKVFSELTILEIIELILFLIFFIENIDNAIIEIVILLTNVPKNI